MLKIFVKLMVLLVVMALAGPFFLRGHDGRPLLTLSDLKLPEFNLSLLRGSDHRSDDKPKPWIQWSRDSKPNPSQLTPQQLAELNLKEQPNIYYRWRDHNDVWQFSTLPNPHTVNYVVRTDPDANVLKSLDNKDIDRVLGRVSATEPDDKNSKKDPTAKAGDKNSPTATDTASQAVPTTIPVSEIPKLLEKAKEVQKILAERAKQMDALTH